MAGLKAPTSSASSSIGKLRAPGSSSGGGGGIGGILKGGLSPIARVLGTLGYLQSGVVSGLKESSDLVTGNSASLGEWWKQTSNHYGVGDTSIGKSLYKTNPWLGRAYGLAGDILTDPLTYLTLGATKAGAAVGKNSVLRELGESGVQKFGKEEASRLSAEVSKKGLSALEKADQSALGVKSSIQFGIKGHKADLGGEALARAVAKAGVATKALPGIKQLDSGVTRLFESDAAHAAKDALGKAASPLKVSAFKDATVNAAQEGKLVASAARQKFEELLAKHAGADPVLVNKALQSESLGDDAVRALVGDNNLAAAKDMRALYDETRTAMADATGAQIGQRAEYSPWQFSDELKKVLEGSPPGSNRPGLAAFSKRRDLADEGATFLGKKVEDFLPDGVSNAGATMAQKQDAVNAIAKEVFGDDAANVFNDNAFDLFAGYLRGVDKYVASNSLKKHIALSDVLSKDAPVYAQAGAASREKANQLKQTADQLLADGNNEAAEAASVAAHAEETLASTIEQGVKEPDAIKVSKALSRKDQLDQIQAMGQDALSAFIRGRESEPWVADAIMRYQDALRPSNPNSVVRMFDKVTNLWKAQALLSPGFHFRNYFGGLFNNALDGVEFKDYADDISWLSGGPAPSKAIEDGWAKASEIGKHNIRDVADVNTQALGKASKARKVIGTPVRLNFAAAGKVEDRLRRPLFIHEMRINGGDWQKALEKVNEFHFDYSDLNRFEREGIKRVIPFYTWSRKNFPLQIENMIRQPGKYTRWMHVKDNTEIGVPDDPLMPSFLKDLLAIRSPFAPGGNRLYLTPDLPFRDLSENLDPMSIVSQANPLIKTPLELGIGTKFFEKRPFDERYKPVPGAYSKILNIPGVGEAFDVLSKFPGAPEIKRSKSGQWMAKERELYKLEQALPFLGRIKRIVPSDPKSQARAVSSWASFFFGVSSTTNDPSAQYGELLRRQKISQAKAAADKALAA